MKLRLALAVLFLALTTVPAAAQPATFENVFSEGVAARRAGNLAQAIQRLEQAVALRPDSAEALYHLGLAYAFAERYAEAEARLSRARVMAPRDADIRLGLARVKAWRRDYDGAAAEIDGLLADQPDNLEALAFRGRNSFYRGLHEDAAADFRAVLARDPRHVEALLGLGDAQAAAGNEAAARDTWRRAAEVDPASAEARERLARPLTPARSWRVDIAGFYSSFERQSREPWREGTAQLSYAYTHATQVHVRSEVSQRFGKIDTYFQTGLDHRFLPWLTAYGALGGTPDPDFREKNAVLAGGAVRLRTAAEPLGATLTLIDIKRAQYGTGTVETVSPGLQQYFFDGRFWLTAKRIFSDDERGKDLKGWSLRADMRPFERLGLYAGYADAPESSEGRTQDARSRFGGIIFDLTEDLSLRLDYLREDRLNSYVREQVGLGFGLRF